MKKVGWYVEAALPGILILLGLVLFSVLVPETHKLWHGYWRMVVDILHWSSVFLVLMVLVLFPAFLGLVVGNKAHWETEDGDPEWAWAMILMSIAIAMGIVWPVIVKWLADFDSYLAASFREFGTGWTRFENPPIGWGIYAGGLFLVIAVIVWRIDSDC